MVSSRSPALRILTFGILLCPGCAAERIFRALAPCRHVTDAHCEECGYSYGRVDVHETISTPTGNAIQTTRRPVISDEAAALAARRYQAATGVLGILPPPPPVDASPSAVEENKSYADDALARLR